MKITLFDIAYNIYCYLVAIVIWNIGKKIYSWLYQLRHSYTRTFHKSPLGWEKKYWFGVNRKFNDADLEDKHICKYCGILTSEPDIYCYKNPENDPLHEIK